MLDSTYRSIGARPAQPSRGNLGIALLSACAAATVLLGIAYLVLSLTTVLLPNDTAQLGMSVSRLCAIDDCRLVDFLSHGRMSYGGALVAIGGMSAWLARGPVRREEDWAWWTLLLAGIATYGTFLMFLAYGYLEPWHALFVGVVSGIGVGGLILTRPAKSPKRRRRPQHRVLELSTRLQGPDGAGRAMIGALAMGIFFSGLSILAIAGSAVFVPQDTDFLGLDSAHVSAVSDRLMPIMAHDRAGFGGGMMALGIMFVATSWWGLQTDARGAWWALAISGLVFYVPTLAIHLAIDYTSFIHLLPVYGGLGFLGVALAILWLPVHRDSPSRQEEPEAIAAGRA